MIVQKNIWDNGNWMTPTFVTASLLLTQNEQPEQSVRFLPADRCAECDTHSSDVLRDMLRWEPSQKAHQNSSANSMAKFAQNLRSAPKL